MSKPRIERLKQNLKNSIIEFTFKKKSNGAIRKAIGTLDKRLMPDSMKEWKRKKGSHRAPVDSVVFYDLKKQAIKSFKDYLLQKIGKRIKFSEYIKQKKSQQDQDTSEKS